MAFWRKKDDKGQDIQAVKDRIQTRSPLPPPPPGIPPIPPVPSYAPLPPAPVQHISGPLPPLPAPVYSEPVDETMGHAMRASEFAPLFVKIDRYKEILQRLEEIKVALHSITDIMVLLNEVEHTRDSTMKALRQGVTDLTDTLIALDGEFIRPEEAEINIPKSREKARVEQYVGELKTELANLKKELARIK